LNIRFIEKNIIDKIVVYIYIYGYKNSGLVHKTGGVWQDYRKLGISQKKCKKMLPPKKICEFRFKKIDEKRVNFHFYP